MGIQETASLERRADENGRRHRAGHKELAVGEVDHEQYAVDHRIAQGDQRVESPLRQTGDDEVQPVVNGIVDAGVEEELADDADDDQDDDDGADQPQGYVDPIRFSEAL